MTPEIEPLPTCRRKAKLSLTLGLAALLAAAISDQAGWPVPDQVLGLLTGVGVGAVLSAVVLWFTPDNDDAVPHALRQRFYRATVPVLAVYVAVMLAWQPLLDALSAPGWRLLVALLPAGLVLWIMRSFVRFIADSDELQRRIELESGAVAGLLVSAGYMAAGFLQTAALIEVPAKLAMLWVFPSLCFVYLVARVVIGRRYQ